MSSNKDLVQSLYQAFSEGDMPTVLSALADDISWTEAEGFPYAGTYVGADEILSGVFMRIAADWDGWAATPHEHIEEGDTVVTLGTYSGTCKATGKAMKAPLVHVWRIENGKITTFVQHTDTVLVREAMQAG
jgi:ketosteroid isomerase-like protein